MQTKMILLLVLSAVAAMAEIGIDITAAAPKVLTPESVETSDVVITMLPNSPQVKEVVLGKNGLIEGAKSGSLVVDMSSIAPLVAREVGAELKKKGIRMLDAPVSGGEPKAIDGTLSIMVGGDADAFARAEPVMRAYGRSVILMGPSGAGQLTKMCNQITIAGLIQGSAWLDGEGVYKVLPRIAPYMALRAGLGMFIIAAAVLGLYNVIMTIRHGKPLATAPEEVAAP